MPRLNVNGCELNYEVRGSGPALLFIHGLGSCLLDWTPQLEEFAKTHTVIAPDLRGHGESARPKGPYSIQQFADDLRSLLHALKVDSADIVGVSLGGAVAFQTAIDAPKQVRRLVIVNSYPEFVLRTWAQKLFIWQRILMVKLMSFERMGRMVAKRMFPDPDLEPVRQAFLQRYVRNEKRPYLDSLNALFGWSIMHRIGELKCPVLVIAADQDYSPVSAKEEYVRKLANGKLVVIPNSRHATPMERPVQFNRALREFLEQQP